VGLEKLVQGKPFRSRQIQQLFLTREKREMLLIAPVLILWMVIPREFGISLIASREFCTVKYYLQETIGMRFYFYLFIFKFYFIFKLYNIVLVLPNIEMNPPQVYPHSPS